MIKCHQHENKSILWKNKNLRKLNWSSSFVMHTTVIQNNLKNKKEFFFKKKTTNIENEF